MFSRGRTDEVSSIFTIQATGSSDRDETTSQASQSTSGTVPSTPSVVHGATDPSVQIVLRPLIPAAEASGKISNVSSKAALGEFLVALLGWSTYDETVKM